MAKREKWYGTWPAECDICKTALVEKEKFYDARVPYRSWGLLCPDCFQELECKLGTGYGQEYNAKTLEKTGG